MNREPRRIPPKALGALPDRRVTREEAKLPKGSKEALRRSGKHAYSASLPHSKTFGK